MFGKCSIGNYVNHSVELLGVNLQHTQYTLLSLTTLIEQSIPHWFDPIINSIAPYYFRFVNYVIFAPECRRSDGRWLLADVLQLARPAHDRCWMLTPAASRPSGPFVRPPPPGRTGGGSGAEVPLGGKRVTGRGGGGRSETRGGGGGVAAEGPTGGREPHRELFQATFTVVMYSFRMSDVGCPSS